MTKRKENSSYGPRGAGLSVRFWRKVDIREPDKCWLWKAGRFSEGYGVIKNGNRSVTASRVAWELMNGVIPDGYDVMHKCDNPPCCNPNHLKLGTHLQNMADMKEKKRYVPRTKLTLDERKLLETGIRNGIPRKELAASFDITVSYVGYIARSML